MKRSNVAYTSILILLVVGIGSAYLYSNSSYHAIVRIDFNVTVYAYPLGDYAYVTSYALVINFTRLYVVPPIGGNEPAPISYGKGQLNKSLNMGVNVTWLSAANQALFSSKNFFIAFARPGQYSVVLMYIPRDVPRGTYVVNVTYTGQFYQKSSPNCVSVVYYYIVE